MLPWRAKEEKEWGEELGVGRFDYPRLPKIPFDSLQENQLVEELET